MPLQDVSTRIVGCRRTCGCLSQLGRGIAWYTWLGEAARNGAHRVFSLKAGPSSALEVDTPVSPPVRP
jgi:hypothetical protein